MMALELSSDRAVCYKCGTEYSRHKGYFPVSYATLHKGVGYVPVCKSCIDTMYNSYLTQCNDAKNAVRQVCRKLDLYWSDSVFEVVSRKATTRTMMTQYIAKINTVTYAGKSYDDTLSEEGTLWNFVHINTDKTEYIEPGVSDGAFDNSEVPKEILAFWGTEYDPNMYDILEKKFAYYKESFPENAKIDLGTERLLRQLCILEATIDRDNAAGRSVEKSVNTYNTLLGSLNLKPVQRQDDSDMEMSSTPLGVWLYRYENKRPLPEIDDDLKDVNGIKRYIFTWMGHLCKMLGIKNGFSRLYEDEIQKYRIERPEQSGESDEEFYMDILNETEVIDL